MTRRDLFLSTPAALAAQTAQQPAPPPLPQTPEQEMNAARERQHRAAEQLGKVNLPMATEPACHFKA